MCTLRFVAIMTRHKKQAAPIQDRERQFKPDLRLKPACPHKILTATTCPSPTTTSTVARAGETPRHPQQASSAGLAALTLRTENSRSRSSMRAFRESAAMADALSVASFRYSIVMSC